MVPCISMRRLGPFVALQSMQIEGEPRDSQGAAFAFANAWSPANMRVKPTKGLGSSAVSAGLFVLFSAA